MFRCRIGDSYHRWTRPGDITYGVTDHGWRSKLHLNKYHLLLLWIDCQFPDGTHSLLPETHYSCAAINSNQNNRPGPRRIRSRQISKVIFQQDRFTPVNGIWKVLFFLQGKEILENTFFGNCWKIGSGEFLLSEGEIKTHVSWRRGQCLSPLTAPALGAMITYYLFRSYRIFGGAEAAGVKPPWVFKFFLNISTEPHIRSCGKEGTVPVRLYCTCA
jgi:hypothetical protein